MSRPSPAPFEKTYTNVYRGPLKTAARGGSYPNTLTRARQIGETKKPSAIDSVADGSEKFRLWAALLRRLILLRGGLVGGVFLFRRGLGALLGDADAAVGHLPRPLGGGADFDDQPFAARIALLDRDAELLAVGDAGCIFLR